MWRQLVPHTWEKATQSESLSVSVSAKSGGVKKVKILKPWKSAKHWRMPHSPSKAYTSVIQSRAWWPTFHLDTSKHFTDAHSPRVTSIAVRFNRVYSKVTLGTPSTVYSPLFTPWMHEWNHRFNGADCPWRHNTPTFSHEWPSSFVLMVSLSKSLWLRGQHFITCVQSFSHLSFQCHQQHTLRCS